jgi:hypothetical protein
MSKPDLDQKYTKTTGIIQPAVLPNLGHAHIRIAGQVINPEAFPLNLVGGFHPKDVVLYDKIYRIYIHLNRKTGEL